MSSETLVAKTGSRTELQRKYTIYITPTQIVTVAPAIEGGLFIEGPNIGPSNRIKESTEPGNLEDRAGRRPQRELDLEFFGAEPNSSTTALFAGGTIVREIFNAIAIFFGASTRRHIGIQGREPLEDFSGVIGGLFRSTSIGSTNDLQHPQGGSGGHLRRIAGALFYSLSRLVELVY